MRLLYDYAVLEQYYEDTSIPKIQLDEVFRAKGWNGKENQIEFLREFRRRALLEYDDGVNFGTWWNRNHAEKDQSTREVAKDAFAAAEAHAFSVNLEPDWD